MNTSTSTFQSVTVWQPSDLKVEVRYGFFSTVPEAAEMAMRGFDGIFFDKAGLWVDLANGSRATVREGGFVVRRLRETAKMEVVQRALTVDDFEIVPMTLQQILAEPSMRSFGSQSYGVIDENGAAVALPLKH